MFALFYTAFMAVTSIGSGAKAAIENHKLKQKALNEKRTGKNLLNVYADYKGALRDLTTNELRTADHISCENDGRDAYLRDQNGNPIRNLSEERRLARMRQAKAHNSEGRTVCKWKPNVPKVIEGPAGEQYKDMHTGKIYVCRLINLNNKRYAPNDTGNFYMDIETGLLVRETDGQKQRRRHGNYDVSYEEITRFIKDFNDKQKGDGYFLQGRKIKCKDYYYCNALKSFDY